MSVRIYGQTMGHGSMTNVTAGMLDGLRKNGVEVQGLVSLDVVMNEFDEPDETEGGALATHGILTSMPNQLDCFARGRHRLRWTLVSPNSSQIGSRLQSLLLDGTDRIITPSVWGANTLQALFAGKVPVHVVPHGVSDSIKPHKQALEVAKAAYDEGEFHLVHFSSSAFERKGTRTLIRAFANAVKKKWIPEVSVLQLVLDRSAATGIMEWMLDEELHKAHIMVQPRQDLSAEFVGHFLGQFHAVVQPSRGEAFGLVPLESRCCGVPAIMTRCTGHQMHFAETGTVIIHSGPDAPIDDLPGSVAPTVEVDAVAHALERCYANWKWHSDSLAGACESIREKWSWKNQTRRFAQELKEPT